MKRHFIDSGPAAVQQQLLTRRSDTRVFDLCSLSPFVHIFTALITKQWLLATSIKSKASFIPQSASISNWPNSR